MTVTRFAPSPTGLLHVGNLRPALLNWMIARKAGGTFILRIDDTDAERSKQEYIDAIREDLTWLGLTWDREEHQSKRLDRYASAADRLRADGRLYEAFETPQELALKRRSQLNRGKPPVYDRAALALSDAEKDALRAERGGHWRFLLDQERVAWQDGIQGDVSIDSASVSDPVLIRGDGQVLYTLASVVDDMEMGITHVVRGADHITNTATQVQMIGALGRDAPVFAHHSLLTGPEGEALSKRLGTLSLRDLREKGLEPLAILSLLARLGTSQPVVPCASHAELIDGFDLSSFGTAPTRLNPDDFAPLSAKLVHAMPTEQVADRLSALGIPREVQVTFWPTVRENLQSVEDAATWWAICQNGAEPLVDDEDRAFVDQALDLLPAQPWTETSWADWTAEVKAATGRKGGALFRPLRKALTGQGQGPEMAALMPLMHGPVRK